MKKIITILMLFHCMSVSAVEYSSDHEDRHRYQNEPEEWLESDSSRAMPKRRYQQNYEQFQIYIAPNQYPYQKPRNSRFDDKQYREERYWRERREELEQKPQRPYRDNSFYQDENHW